MLRNALVALSLGPMNEAEMCEQEVPLQQKADRARRIIYVVMALFVLLPFLVIWITGAIRFE